MPPPCVPPLGRGKTMFFVISPPLPGKKAGYILGHIHNHFEEITDLFFLGPHFGVFWSNEKLNKWSTHRQLVGCLKYCNLICWAHFKAHSEDLKYLGFCKATFWVFLVSIKAKQCSTKYNALQRNYKLFEFLRVAVTWLWFNPIFTGRLATLSLQGGGQIDPLYILVGKLSKTFIMLHEMNIYTFLCHQMCFWDFFHLFYRFFTSILLIDAISRGNLEKNCNYRYFWSISLKHGLWEKSNFHRSKSCWVFKI